MHESKHTMLKGLNFKGKN